jgi:hypothetical protein
VHDGPVEAREAGRWDVGVQRVVVASDFFYVTDLLVIFYG